MIHFTCTNCTADLSAEDSQRFIKCGWCRRQIEVPRLTKIELDSFTRANRQRQSKQFAEAEKNYQLVLNSHPQDHEALWGLVLCHYGIVYVEDKGDVLPTCWICRPQPILEHPDYQYACKLAPPEIRAQRERDGQYICKAQQYIRRLGETMQPYDIFLCYKHSVIGNPDALTEDSQLANDLCLMLSKEGYRVFYAPVDTKGRAGENYESLIYHALKTAKVMLTISTRPDHLLCSWPQSEWSRFIYMMNQGEDKHLIPLYKHMRVSTLPDAFLNRGWTAFDMGNQFYGKYLLDNLERYIHKRHEKAAPPVSEPTAEPKAAYLCAAATLFAKPDAASQALTQMPANAALLALERVRATNGAFWYMVQVGMDVGYVIYGAVKLGDAPVVATPVAKVETPMVAEQPVQKAVTPTVTEQKPVTQSAPAAVPQVPKKDAEKPVQKDETPASFLKYSVSADGTVTITGHTEQIAKVSKLDIPRLIEGKRVTSIGDRAFEACTSLTSISIPDSIAYIGDSVFYYCTSLTSILVSPDHPILATIDGVLFTKPDKRLICYPCAFTSSIYVIPSGIRSIGKYAFAQCTSLTSITLPDSVTSIGGGAFRDCTNLASISIPNSVKFIHEEAFSGCTSLTNISIPDSVTYICGSAFESCTSLTSIFIPDSVTAIGPEAFAGCTSLTSISILNSVTIIGEEAFSGCTSLTNISIPDSVTSIGQNVFWECANLTIHAPYGSYAIHYAKEHSIPYKELGTPAAVPQEPKKNAEKPVQKDQTPASFFKYSVLADGTVTITGHTEQIAKINKLGIPRQIEGKSVTAIGAAAFESCTNLTSIFIPDSVTYICDDAFCGCTSLTSISIPDSVTYICGSAFESCTSLTSISIPDSVKYIGCSTFKDCTSLTSISIPDSSTSIGGATFKGCTSLTSIFIPGSVTKIGNWAFQDCTSLTSISIPDSITSIGDGAFAGCTSLTSIFTPNGVTSIGAFAFYTCTSLTSIFIPDSVKYIDSRAFINCTSLTIYAPADSEAIRYAKEHSIPYKQSTAPSTLLVHGYISRVQAPPSRDTSDSLSPAFKQKMREAFHLNASTEILYASGLFGLAFVNSPCGRYYFTSTGVIFPRLGMLGTLQTSNPLRLTWKEFMTAAIEDTTILKLHYIKINGQTVHAAGPFGGAGTKANVDKWLAFYHGLQDYLLKNAHLIEP